MFEGEPQDCRFWLIRHLRLQMRLHEDLLNNAMSMLGDMYASRKADSVSMQVQGSTR